MAPYMLIRPVLQKIENPGQLVRTIRKSYISLLGFRKTSANTGLSRSANLN